MKGIKSGAFDAAAWQAATKKATASSFEQLLTAIAAHELEYATLLGGYSDNDFRGQSALCVGNPRSAGGRTGPHKGHSVNQAREKRR